MKISTGYATPRDLIALYHSFIPIESLANLLNPISSTWLQNEVQKLDPLPEMNRQIAQALVDEPPLRMGRGKDFPRWISS